MGSSPPINNNIVLFDGVCNLCNASVQFIIKRDPNHKLKFASLQSEVGSLMLSRFNFSLDEFHSIIFIRENKAFQNSDAVLQIVRLLRQPWPLIYYLGRIVPRFIRDGIYRALSKNRYRIFGRRDECMIPTPDLKSRFL